MAIQTLIPGYNPNAALGQSLGQGLGGLLEGLASNKVNQMHQKQQAQSLQSVLGGLSAEQAQSLAGLSPDIQQLFVKDLLAQPSQQAYAQALGVGGSQQVPQQAQSQLSPFESLQLLQGNITPEIAQKLQQVPNVQQQEQVNQPARLTERQATEIAKLKRDEQKQAHKEKQDAFKFNKDVIKDVSEKSKSAKQALHDLDRMEELQKEGKLDTPGYVEFLNRSGLSIPALMSEGSEEFNKIAQNFLRNAKQYYGGRVSNFEVEQFLKTIPSLSQSPQGRQRVIANLKNISRAELEYTKAVRDVIKDNKGIPPFDLALQIEERVEKQSKKLADKFKKDLAKPVPKGQNKFITGLQTVAGSTVGLLSKAIPTALGAGAGYLAGGPLGALGSGISSLFGPKS